MQLKDSPTSYSWISIALHWAGAIAIVMLWFIGNSMSSENIGELEYASLVHIHTSVATMVYCLLIIRIVHRVTVGFPNTPSDIPRIRRILTRLVQGFLLIGMTAMLISGPLMVWANGDVIGVFNWGGLPSPIPSNAALHELMLKIHQISRWALLAGVLAHVFGVFMSGSETLNRILITPPSSKKTHTA